MVMDAVVERFIEQSPVTVTVMAQLALQRALDPAWLDALFEQESLALPLKGGTYALHRLSY